MQIILLKHINTYINYKDYLENALIEQFLSIFWTSVRYEQL